MSAPIYTVIVVEDEPEMGQQLQALINAHPRLSLLAYAADVAEGITQLRNHNPDILLTDLGLPDGSGVEIIDAIHHFGLDSQAMVVSGFQDEHHVFKALQAGAKSYILKHDTDHNITDAVLTMMEGGAPISPVIARLMLQKFQPTPPVLELPEPLTERQIRILKLISQGFSSKEIAEKLSISYYTVTTHIKNIYGKLAVNSRTEALCEAGKLGLLRDR